MRKVKLKPLAEQVIVITGASSGIGLATARMAAEKGAKVVMGARSHEALERSVAEISNRGGEAIFVDCDVTKRSDIEKLANAATGDKVAAKQVDRQQYDEPPRNPEGTLHRAGELTSVSGQVRGTGGQEEE